MALEAYFDGSGSNAPKLLTLAGFAAEDSIWREFDEAWRSILSDSTRRPAARYIHMREANSLEKEFRPANGWNAKKVGFLIFDMLQYLESVDKQRFKMTVCTVDITAYKKLKDKGYVMDPPEEICIRYCPEIIFAWFVTTYPGVIHSAHFFFDPNEPFEGPFRKRWTEGKNKLISPGAMDMFWSLIKSVTPVGMRDKPALQAADLLAWATNRSVARIGQKYQHLSSVMKAIVPWYALLCDEKKLMELYPNSEKQIRV